MYTFVSTYVSLQRSFFETNERVFHLFFLSFVFKRERTGRVISKTKIKNSDLKHWDGFFNVLYRFWRRSLYYYIENTPILFFDPYVSVISHCILCVNLLPASLVIKDLLFSVLPTPFFFIKVREVSCNVLTFVFDFITPPSETDNLHYN